MKIIRKLSEFLRSQEVKPFALTVLILGFFFLYMKVYFVLNKYSFIDIGSVELNQVVFWVGVGKNLLYFVVSVITALGASLITITVIIHSQNRTTPSFFAIFDGAFSLFFFGNNIPQWLEKGEYGYIGLAIAWSIFTAFGLYLLAEMFYLDTIEINKAKALNEQTQSELEKAVTMLTKANEEVSQTNSELSIRIETLTQANEGLSHRIETLTQANEGLSESIEGNDNQTESLAKELKALRIRNKELETQIYERVNARSLASKRGHITYLRKEGRSKEADQKEKELEDELYSPIIDETVFDNPTSSNGHY